MTRRNDPDRFDQYEEMYDPVNIDRKARRKRKPRKQQPKKDNQQIVNEIAEVRGLEGEFQTTYQPARYEKGWLLESLKVFYDEEWISDVLASIKGGKEASVYRCAGVPRSKYDLMAVKVYRPRQFRNLRNDFMYREGREVLTGDGKMVKSNEDRIIRALGKKTTFGAQVQHTSWLMYEYTTLEQLHAAGAAVPQPVAASDNAILMEYFGDERRAAPALHEINLDEDEAEDLFKEVVRNLEIMLQHDVIHGDLSAFNILYWEGEIMVIDFPQVTNPYSNKNAYFIFERDVTRVCEYFAKQGIDCDPESLTAELWQRFVKITDEEKAADESRMVEM